MAGVHRSRAEDHGACPSPSEGLYDGGAPKPFEGRVQPDDSTRSEALLRCKRPFIMGTFNACTVRENSRMLELAHCAEENGVEILGVQEHRRVHQDQDRDTTLHCKAGKSTFITCSAWRNTVQAATGGVGLLLSPRANKALQGPPKRHSERIMSATFDGNPATTVIVVYAPTDTDKNKEATESFYRDLRRTISAVPAHHFLAVLGDFNARLGPDDADNTFHDKTSKNGEHLISLLREHELLAANTLFQKKLGKRWTFQNRGTNKRSQLDYILIRRKWRNSVTNVEPYNTFSTVGSDHRVVSMRVRLSLRVPKTSPKIRRDWRALKTSTDLQARYTVEVRNRFQPLSEEEDPDTRNNRLLTAHKEAAEECIPVMKRSRTSLRSRHPEVVAAREEAMKTKMSYEAEKTEDRHRDMNRAKEQLFKTYDKIDEEELLKKVRRVEAAQGEQKYEESWRVINEISGRKRTKEGQITGNSPEERVNTWFTHFKNLLGEPPGEEEEMEIAAVLPELNINDGPFTAAELARAKSTLKTGKSAGPDGIPPEVYKYCDLDNINLETCNRALMGNEKPDIWSLSNIIPVPKSGDLSKPDNYRGISLTCVIAKLYNRMILNRIRSAIDPYLRENQNGFREGRSTVTQILALRRLIEEVKKNNMKAVLCFIDFKKAFDSINRSVMMKILKAYSVPPNLHRAIENMYTNTRARVMSPDGCSEEFNIRTGVLQGDTLAPFLFIIVLDYALRYIALL